MLNLGGITREQCKPTKLGLKGLIKKMKQVQSTESKLNSGLSKIRKKPKVKTE